MLPWLLAVTGGALSLYCLGRLQRWLQAGPAMLPERLPSLVDELIAAAESTVAVVDERAEGLMGAIAQADERIARLQALTERGPSQDGSGQLGLNERTPLAIPPPWAGAPDPAPPIRRQAAPSPSGDLHSQVYELADAGLDVAAIARQLTMTKGEVDLILGLRAAADKGG